MSDAMLKTVCRVAAVIWCATGMGIDCAHASTPSDPSSSSSSSASSSASQTEAALTPAEEAECVRLANLLEKHFALSKEELDWLREEIAHRLGVCDAIGIEKDINEKFENRPERKVILFFDTPLEDIPDTRGKYKGVYTRGLNLCYLRALGPIDHPAFKGIRILGTLKNLYALFMRDPVKIEEAKEWKRQEYLNNNKGTTAEDAEKYLKEKCNFESATQKRLRDFCEGKLDLASLKIPEAISNDVECFFELLERIKAILSRNKQFILDTEYYGNTNDRSLADAMNIIKDIKLEIAKIETATTRLMDFFSDPNSSQLFEKGGDFLTFAQLFSAFKNDIIPGLSTIGGLPDGLSHYTLVPAYTDFSRTDGNIAMFYHRGFDDKGCPYPQNAWAIFCGDGTKDGGIGIGDYRLYDRLGTQTKNQEGARLDGEPECRLKTYRESELANHNISHHILIDGIHAERLIPLRYYEKIKEMLRARDVFVMDAGVIRYNG